MKGFKAFCYACLILQVDFKLKFDRRRVLVMHHAYFDNVENDKVLACAGRNNLNASEDFISVSNSQILHQLNELL